MGKSSADFDTSQMTMNSFVEDLEGIRKAFGLQKMNLIGHSWGGLVSMFYAIKYPSHLQSLILVNTTPASSTLRNLSFAVMSSRTTKEDSIAQLQIAETEGFKKRDPAAMAKFFRLLFRGSFHNKQYADSLTLTFDSSYSAKSAMVRQLSRDSTLRSTTFMQDLMLFNVRLFSSEGPTMRLFPARTNRFMITFTVRNTSSSPNADTFRILKQVRDFFRW